MILFLTYNYSLYFSCSRKVTKCRRCTWCY